MTFIKVQSGYCTSWYTSLSFLRRIFSSTDILEVNGYQRVKAIVDDCKFKVIERSVTDYYPMSKDDHGLESFTVDGLNSITHTIKQGAPVPDLVNASFIRQINSFT